MFCAPKLVFSGSEGVRCIFHVLRSQIHVRGYRERRVPFSYLAHPDSLSAVPKVSGSVFIFRAPEHIFGGTVGVRSFFHVFRPRTRFRRYQRHRDQLSNFALPDSFSAATRASCLVFMFCTVGLVFGGTEGAKSRFHNLRA
jgi:hypothetical protein